MFNIIRWADEHGEERMTRSQFERAEQQADAGLRPERPRGPFTVEFTRDELDWLLGDLLPSLAELRTDERLDILCSIRLWANQLKAHGYSLEGCE
jgi:hypothetical protein